MAEEKGRETPYQTQKEGAARHEREEIEMYRCRNDAQKIFKNVKRLTEGFKPGVYGGISFLRYYEAKATLMPPLEKTANRH